jgi:hypothetical protein
MEILNARYTAFGSITALVDGVQMFIPTDAGNRHYAAMLEQGITPAAYVEPAPTADQVRAKRDALFVAVVDPLVSNTLRWADMTPEAQQAWADYRRALLDVPQQAGFPNDVAWPLQPTF